MNTHIASNWSVIVFECHIDSIPSVIPVIWKLFHKNLNELIPHYSIRQYYGDSSIISLRIFKPESDSSKLTKEINQILIENDCKIIQDNRYNKFHAWIKKDASIWNLDRSISLHDFSNLAVRLMERGLWRNNKEVSGVHAVHLFSNMLGIEDTLCYDFVLKLLIPRRNMKDICKDFD